MSLQEEISSVVAQMSTAMPDETRQALIGAKISFEQSFDRTTAIQPGQNLPEFNLPDAVGEPVSSAALLSTGLLLITFYRGSWCPFCDLALRALQKHLTEFKARAVTLVAITPELPDFSLSITKKHNLEFRVLTDTGNKYAKKLGLLYRVPDSLRPVYEGARKDLKLHNGNDEFSVPIPATILVGKDGVVREAFVDPDYMKRVEPAVVLGWIDALEE